MRSREAAAVESQQDYSEFIKTLYDSRKTLVAGLVGHVICLSAVYWSTHDPVYLFGAAAMIVIWALRNVDMLRFDRETANGLTAEAAKRWERRYIFGSASGVLMLGSTGAYSIYLHQDATAMIVAVGLNMTALVATVGRNFGSKANIDIMSGVACFPLAIAMFLSGNIFLAVIGLSFIPMYFSTRDMAKTVRSILQDALETGRSFQTVADQFEAALNNMPHGLLMFGTDNRVAVSNLKAAQLLGFTSDVSLQGHTVGAIIRLGMRRGWISPQHGTEMKEQFSRLLSGESARETVETKENQFFEVSAMIREGKGVVLNFEDVTDRIMSERKVVRLARYDSLSGLPNRTYMAELVHEAVENMADDEQIYFSVFDVDHFKQINDTMGHQAGDRVIQTVGQKMQELDEKRLISARLGGDEFVFALTGIKADEDVVTILDSLYGQIAGSYMINGKKLDVMISGGVIAYSRKTFDLDEALIKADLALYEAKKAEKTAWTMFEKSMDDELRANLQLKKELQIALAEGGLSAAYQPMLSADGLNIVCCEALARWQHPELGNIPPNRFIPVAEMMGMVSEVTKQILRTACRDCMTWPEHMTVSVNLSAVDVANRDIVDVIRAALAESGLAPERLQVEITETMLVADAKKTGAILKEIRDMGVKTALDDFGTGYSSLNYLHSFPIDKIKIDRSFVDSITSDEKALNLLRSMIRLLKDLGFDIVVEGVETKEQLETLRLIGFTDLVQGYVFGRPMQPDMLPGYVADVNLKQLRSATVHRLSKWEKVTA